MRQPKPFHTARALAPAIRALCEQLESHGIEVHCQGEALIADLVGLREAADPADAANGLTPTPVLLCRSDADRLLAALPRAVVTGEHRTRLTQATADGPVDLLPTGTGAGSGIEAVLLRFGLGPLAIGFRPATEAWCDPASQRRALLEGRLEPATLRPNPFVLAPRRYWIAARMLAELDLEPSTELIEAASKAFPTMEDELPQAAPARRAISRILASAAPEKGLAFLRRVGVTGRIAPGSHPEIDARIARLPALPALRWAAWLRGGSTTQCLVRLRVPHALARRVERLQAAHPLDRTLAGRGEAGARRLLQRFEPEEIAALVAWRRFELETREQDDSVRAARKTLDDFATAIESVRSAAARSGQVRTLALDGRAVMAALGAGPGPHVGRALAHLADWVADRPEANAAEPLRAELARWAEQSLGPDREIG